MPRNGYNLTERTRKVLAIARRIGCERGHSIIQPEHIALALLAEGEGVACAVIQHHAVPFDHLVRALGAGLAAGAEPLGKDLDLPYSEAAKEVLQQTMVESVGLDHSYVGTEHLLLALVHEPTSPIAKVFASHGLDHDRVRTMTEKVLTTPPWPA